MNDMLQEALVVPYTINGWSYSDKDNDDLTFTTDPSSLLNSCLGDDQCTLQSCSQYKW